MCVTGPITPPPLPIGMSRGCLPIFRRADDVTQAMSKGGGVLVNFSGGGMMSRGQCPRGGGACDCLHPPPPSGNPVSAPVLIDVYFQWLTGSYRCTCILISIEDQLVYWSRQWNQETKRSILKVYVKSRWFSRCFCDQRWQPSYTFFNPAEKTPCPTGPSPPQLNYAATPPRC